MEKIDYAIKEQTYNQYKGLRYNLSHEDLQESNPGIATEENRLRFAREPEQSVMFSFFNDYVEKLTK